MADVDRSSQVALFELVSTAPFYVRARASGNGGAHDENGAVDELLGLARRDGLSALETALERPVVRDLVSGIWCGSPYLTGLIKCDVARFERVLSAPPEQHFEVLVRAVREDVLAAQSMDAVMAALRAFKSEVALLLAIVDLGGVWDVMKITHALSVTAEVALQAGVGFLFRQATARGEWVGESNSEDGSRSPETTSGYIVLGMGKFGGYELNYSSDIDLIVFFDPSKAQLREGVEVQNFFVRMTRDVVRMMDERTAQGYVFRTDLRLRPDPGATQVALSTDAAMIYYESFGQNWERAALIKARPVAGDIEAGEQVLEALQPFVWRRYLDFAAIGDIRAMKRQIHAFRGFGEIAVPGHNVKLGRGGIREIEFFIQAQQLIAGGRQDALRSRSTLQALDDLSTREWVLPEARDELRDAYLFLRGIEHRLQMVADEQTHTLPSDAEALERFSRFCGYCDVAALEAALVPVLRRVQHHYTDLFKEEHATTADGFNMVFAGQDDDPETVAVLSRMGFSQPSSVIATVRSWHHGRYAAVRSDRSRERLTELQASLIEALSETADPDGAFSSFDRFLSELPTGIQLFSVLRSKPGLLQLVADIMGTAPRLARILSRRRRMLDAVIDPRTLDELPSAQALGDLLSDQLDSSASFEEVLDQARVLGGEQSFLLGVRVLSGIINSDQAGAAYALLATCLLQALLAKVESELASTAGRVAGGSTVVIAMGKLGGLEMTAASDLDLIVVYDHDDACKSSDGERPLSVNHYFARLTQRLITALSAPTAEGLLYEVDMRLRPSGQKGPVATRLEGFARYQLEEAWTWEHMALTRARVVSGPLELRARVESAIRDALVVPRDQAKVARDVREMRARIATEKGTDRIWDLKQVRGGLVDLEFIAQYLQLIHASEKPEVLDQNTLVAFHNLRAAGVLSDRHADVLIPTAKLVSNLTQILRICIEDKFEPSSAPRGLKDLLARAGEEPTFEALELRLRDALAQVAVVFDEIVAEAG